MATAKLSSPTDLLRRAWERLKSRWALAVIITILTSLVYFGVAMLFAAAVVAVGPNLGLNTALSGAALWFVVALLAGVYFSALMFVYMSDDQPISLGQALSRTSKVYWPLFVTAIVSGLVLAGATALLVIPGIILAIYFSQAQLVTINEGLKGQTALRRSRAMIDGQWGATIWRFIFLAVIMALVNIVAAGILKLLGAGQDSAENVASMVTSLVTGPLSAAYMVEMYRDLKKNTGEKGSRSLYTILGGLGVIMVIGCVSMISAMSSTMRGTFSSEWQKAINESGMMQTSGSSSYNWSWGADTANTN